MLNNNFLLLFSSKVTWASITSFSVFLELLLDEELKEKTEKKTRKQTENDNSDMGKDIHKNNLSQL